MPYSNFTKLLCGLLVAVSAVVVLYPAEWPLRYAGPFAISLAMVLLVFAWRIVRDAAPFDDRAFHRTLPPGDNAAFWRVAGQPLAIIGGIALMVAVHCWQRGYGWWTLSYGWAFSAFPFMAWMGICGVASSLTITNQGSRVWGWVIVFGAPVWSWGVMAAMRQGFDPEAARIVIFSHWRVIVLSAAFLYPLIWWLIAAKRRSVMGGVFAFLAGGLMPWLFIYGDLGEEFAPRWTMVAEPEPQSSVRLIRKELPPADPNLAGEIDALPLKGLFDIENLKEDELFQIWSISQTSGSGRPGSFPVFSMLNGKFPSQRWDLSALLAAHSEGGSGIAWGLRGAWAPFRRYFPESARVLSWSRDQMENCEATVVLRNPNIGAVNPGVVVNINTGDENRPVYHEIAMTRDDLSGCSWGIEACVLKVGKPRVFEASKGGSVRLAEGGALVVETVQKIDGSYQIPLQIYQEKEWLPDGPWLKRRKDNILFIPWIFAIDPQGQQVEALPVPNFSGDLDTRVFGARTTLLIDLGPGETREQMERIEKLKRCRLYVFVPTRTTVRQLLSPP